MHVLQPEGEHDLLDERKRERDVDRRRHKRQEEHEQHLRADGRLDLLRRHADLLHDAEAAAVVIALGDLLVVDDEHRRKQEHEPEEKAEEQKAAVRAAQRGIAVGAHIGRVLHVRRLGSGLKRGVAEKRVQRVELLVVRAGEVELVCVVEHTTGAAVLAGVGVLLRAQLEHAVEIRHDQIERVQTHDGAAAVEREAVELPQAERAAADRHRVAEGLAVRPCERLAGRERHLLTGQVGIALRVQNQNGVCIDARAGELIERIAAAQRGKPDGAIAVHVALREPRARHGVIHHLQNRRDVRHRVRPGVGHERERHILRPAHGGVGIHALIQTHRGRDRHKHHRREDADARKTGRVAAHAVDETGDGGKVAGFIVVAPVFAQRLEYDDAQRDKREIRADDDKDDRREEILDGVQGRVCAQGNDIARGKAHRTEQCEDPLAARLALALTAGAQQLHGVGQMDDADGVEQEQQKQRAEKRRRIADAHQADVQPERSLPADEPHEHELQELGEHTRRHEAEKQRHGRRIQRLPEEHIGDVALFHAEDVVDGKLTLALLGEGTVRIKEDDGGKQRHDQHAETEHLTDAAAVLHLTEIRIAREREDDAKQRHDHDAGQQIRQVEPAVFLQIRRRQTRVEVTHGAHRPLPAS